jgi:hypothetical protein
MRRSAWRRLTARLGPQNSSQVAALSEVSPFVVDAAEELGMGGGTASGDGGKGAALAEQAAEVEGFAGIGGDLRFVHGLRFVHRNSGASETGQTCPAGDDTFY